MQVSRLKNSSNVTVSGAMKLIILFIVSLIFTGCSSTYRVSNFSSKEKFYEDFNNSVKNKELEITLINDSSFSVLEGSKIADDSLDLILSFQNKEHTLASNEIENIKYYGDSYSSPSAYIMLKNGQLINGENIQILPDSSIRCVEVKVNGTKVPLTDVKKVSYKKHWLGILPGLLIGVPAGFVLGIAIGQSFDKNKDAQGTESFFAVFGAPMGALAGIIYGWIAGWEYNYYFNQ